MLKTLFICFFLLVVGCSSTKNIKKDYELNSATEKGVILTSISYQGGYSGYSIQYSDQTYKNKGSIQFGEGVALLPIPPKGDYSDIGKRGELFAIEVPAGEYKIHGWLVFSGYATIKPSAPISINFNVQPGKATYIGNFNFVQTNSFGLTVTGIKVNYSEQSDEDFKVLEKKYPNITKDQIIMGIKQDELVKGVGGNDRTSWDMPIFIM